MAIKTFTTGEVLTAADTNTYLANAGLDYIAQTTFTTTTTPFINGCFSSTYDNYRVLLGVTGSAVSADVRLRLRYATSTVENGAVYDRWGFVSSTVLTVSNSADQTSAVLGAVANVASSYMVCAMDIFNASNASLATVLQIQAWNATNGSIGFWNNRIETTRAYTGIEMTADSGNLTGYMRVYGYRQA